MTGFSVAKLWKNKKRRVLVISGGGPQSGIQCIYFSFSGTWEILGHAMVPYPQRVTALLEKFSSGTVDQFKTSELAWLDLKITQLMAECAKTTLASAPRSASLPHLIVLNKLLLWKGATGENSQQQNWDLNVGDAQYIASAFNVPVISDFTRNNMIAGGNGTLPVNPGNLAIVSKDPGISILVNIGVFSQTTIVDTSKSAILSDSVTGPGTCLIDKTVRELSENETFDRDGTLAAQGCVDGNCLDTLVTSPWFLQNGSKTATADQFDELLDTPSLKALSPYDRLATVTALTAKAVYNYYRTEYKETTQPDRIYLSGGGANNLTLQEYLKAYFQTIPIKSIDSLGIPMDMRIPFALGLTVNSFISGVNIPFESGPAPKISSIGRWYFS